MGRAGKGSHNLCCVVDIEIDDVSTSLSQIFINFTNNFPQKIQQKKKLDITKYTCASYMGFLLVCFLFIYIYSH